MNKQPRYIKQYSTVTGRYTHTIFTTRRTITREIVSITTITIQYKRNKRLDAMDATSIVLQHER